MANYEFFVDYFINTTDGNLSLGTTERRIEEAVKTLKSGKDTILLTGLNKIVTNGSELKEAIEEHLKTTKK